MRLIHAAFFLSMAALPAAAQDLPSGTYDLSVDGGTGRAAVVSGLMTMSIAGPGCLGTVTGPLSTESEGAWEVNLDSDRGLCTVAVIAQANGNYVVEEANCGVYHGAGCGFEGTMTQTGGSSNAEAMREAFAAFEPEGRMAVQYVLGQLGVYGGGVDGAYGPATAAALAQLP